MKSRNTTIHLTSTTSKLLFLIGFTLLSANILAEEAIAELSPVVVWGERLRMGDNQPDDSLWRGAPPALSIRNQSEAGALVDLSINGSAFSESGIIFNGAAVRNAQTEHFNGDLSCPSDWLETPNVLTGIDLFRSSAGHSAGSLETRMAPVASRGGKATLGVGTDGLYFLRANDREFFNITDSVYGWVGAFVEAAHADRIDGYEENDLDRFSVGGRFGMAAEYWTFDALISYRWREFGCRGAYGYDARPAWEANKSGLLSMDWIYDAGEDQRSEISLLWSRAHDAYRLDEENPDYYENKHLADEIVLHMTTRRHLTDWLFVDLRGDTEFEVYDTRRHHNYTGMSPYTKKSRYDRVHGSYAVLPGVKFDRWEVTAGASAEFYSAFNSECNPAAGIAYYFDEQEWSKIELSYREATRMPSYTELTYESPATVGTYDLPLSHTRTLALDLTYRPTTAATLERVRAGAFLSRSERLTDWLKLNPNGRWTATALEPVTFFGFSGDTVVKVTDSLKLMADGAVIVKETDTDYYSSRYVMDYPIASFALEARYDITDDWRVSYRQGVEAWKSNPIRDGSSVRNVSRLETEFKLPFCRDISFALGLADIFDQAFEVVPGQKARGFTGYLSVTYAW